MQPQKKVFPNYPSIIPTVLGVIAARILGRSRSLHADAVRLTGRIIPPVKVIGSENIPASGGFLIVVNHYARPGYSTAWIALSLGAVIPSEIAFVMSEAWSFEGNPLGFILRPIMKAILASITRVYGFLSMPSIAAGFSDATTRAAAVRRVMHFARNHPNAVIGLAPEGQDSPPDGVGLAPVGGGKFMLALNRMGFALLPVVVIENEGQLIVKIGQTFGLSTELDEPSARVDLAVRSLVRDKQQRLFESIHD